MPSLKPNDLTIEEQKTILENTAIRYLSFRPRFRAEIFTKLGQKANELALKEPFTLINQIVDSLVKSGYLNDEKLLESYIRTKLQNKFKGPFWIKMHLLRFGLSKFEIDTALKLHAGKTIQLEIIKDYFTKKGVSSTLEMKEKARVFRSLSSRGFSAELIMQAFDQIPSLG